MKLYIYMVYFYDWYAINIAYFNNFTHLDWLGTFLIYFILFAAVELCDKDLRRVFHMHNK